MYSSPCTRRNHRTPPHAHGESMCSFPRTQWAHILLPTHTADSCRRAESCTPPRSHNGSIILLPMHMLPVTLDPCTPPHAHSRFMYSFPRIHWIDVPTLMADPCALPFSHNGSILSSLRTRRIHVLLPLHTVDPSHSFLPPTTQHLLSTLVYFILRSPVNPFIFLLAGHTVNPSPPSTRPGIRRIHTPFTICHAVLQP